MPLAHRAVHVTVTRIGARGDMPAANFAHRAGGSIFRAMMHMTTVALPPREVLERAKQFFAERVPLVAAFVEKEGPEFVVLRGQGGEEVVVRAWVDGEGKTQVRASTLFFDQALDRFLSTLPLAGEVRVA